MAGERNTINKAITEIQNDKTRIADILIDKFGIYPENFYTSTSQLDVAHLKSLRSWEVALNAWSSPYVLKSNVSGGGSTWGSSLTVDGYTLTIPSKPTYTKSDVGLGNVSNTAQVTDLALYTGNSTAKNTTKSLTNGNVYLKINKTVSGTESEDSKVKISGSKLTEVTTDSSGNIVVTTDAREGFGPVVKSSTGNYYGFSLTSNENKTILNAYGISSLSNSGLIGNLVLEPYIKAPGFMIGDKEVIAVLDNSNYVTVNTDYITVRGTSFKLNSNSEMGWFGSIPNIGSDGVMEIGLYIDFHEQTNNTADYDTRLSSSGGNVMVSGNPGKVYANGFTILSSGLEVVNIISTSITAPTFYASSDKSLKTNIENISDSIVSFNWKDSGKKSYGFIAQELEKTNPELVNTKEDGLKVVDYNAALALTIAKLENRVKELEDKLLKYDNI